MAETRRLDPDTLKALAHPLRLHLLDALQQESATATHLAERFGQNTGTTSWHLRQLARYGLIEDDPDRGDARERWWRASARSISLDVREPGFLDDASVLEAARSYVGHRIDQQAANAHRFLATADEHDERWIGATTFSDARLLLTVEEAETLRDDLREVIARYRPDRKAGSPPKAHPVHATVHVFPLPDPCRAPESEARDAS